METDFVTTKSYFETKHHVRQCCNMYQDHANHGNNHTKYVYLGVENYKTHLNKFNVV